MTAPDSASLATWSIALVAVAGVIVRPWRLPEALWALLGASALVVFGLLPWSHALKAIGKGWDVYLFLTGMMLLSELARREGLFDFLAAHAVHRANGSPQRLFLLAYAIGTVVTIFMSNDATAVVLTPAVYAAARKARAEPLPYLLVCAFIANAASFVLPISNPANLVIFGPQLPALTQWLTQFAVPSLIAVVVTYGLHRMLMRSALRGAIASDIDIPALSIAGRTTGYGIIGVALALLAASFYDLPLGGPTLAVTAFVAAVVLLRKRETPWATLKDVSWGVLVLVAGLFVLVEALQYTGVVEHLAAVVQAASQHSTARAAWGAGLGVGVISNLINNLPMGLIAGDALNAMPIDPLVHAAATIGIDLGPNLSVTGSLATILWLTAIRREGANVSAWTFLRYGVVVMPIALVLSLAALLLQA